MSNSANGISEEEVDTEPSFGGTQEFGAEPKSRPLHICFLNMQIEYYSPVSGGAIATVIMNFARSLLARGCRVSVLTIVNKDPVYPAGNVVPLRHGCRENLSFIQRRISGMRGRLNGWDYPYYEYYRDSFMKELKKLSPAPDAVIVYNDFISLKYVKKALPGTKVVLALQNEQRTKYPDIEGALSQADLFAPVCNYIRDWTTKTYNIPRERQVPVSPGVDLDAFKPRENYLAPRKPVRVLFIGRIDPNKGPDIVADAVALLRREGVPLTLTVTGSLWFYGHGNEMANPYFRELKGKMDAAEAHYTGHVTRPDVPALVRDHDIVCVLSRSNEPYGLVTLEGMASGCAVVASNRGGLPESCGKAAIMVNPDDFEAVVSALRSLATRPEMLLHYKQLGIEHAATQSWMAKSAVIEELLTQKPGS